MWICAAVLTPWRKARYHDCIAAGHSIRLVEDAGVADGAESFGTGIVNLVRLSLLHGARPRRVSGSDACSALADAGAVLGLM